MRRAAKPSGGLTIARNRLVAMAATELSAVTAANLIASYGLTLSEADHLIRSFRRVP